MTKREMQMIAKHFERAALDLNDAFYDLRRLYPHLAALYAEEAEGIAKMLIAQAQAMMP